MTGITEHTIKIINEAVDNGFRFFRFDKDTFNLVVSSPDNANSYRDITVYNTIEIYIPEYTTRTKLIAQLKFYGRLDS